MAKPPIAQNETGAPVPAAPVYNAAGISIATATPTVQAAAYASGNTIGGKLTFPSMAREAGGSGLIQMVGLFSKTAQTFACELWLFHTDPNNSAFTDKAAFSLNVLDFDKVAAVVQIASTNWFSAGTPSFAEAAQLAMPYKLASTLTDMYGVLVARATPTLGSTSDVKVVVKALLD